jgi:hypothetical protein
MIRRRISISAMQLQLLCCGLIAITVSPASSIRGSEEMSESSSSNVFDADADTTSEPSPSPTVAPTDISVYDYHYVAGWLGSLSYSAVAIGMLVSACLIAYTQSRKHYNTEIVIAQQAHIKNFGALESNLFVDDEYENEETMLLSKGRAAVGALSAGTPSNCGYTYSTTTQRPMYDY